QDPVLSQVKLIAEPWDVGPGGYMVGSFPWQWAEWNGRYRDTMRRYWKGDEGLNGEFATRFAGSSDLYERSGRRPFASINFVTAHDGFTLEDLVSYERKHNEANGEGNRDGHEPNYSTNQGVEGPTDDEDVLERREQMKRALVSTLLLSQGVPMLLGGDELSRTQQGNNNAYCQDNEINYYDWDLDEREEGFLDFVSQVIAFRRQHTNFRRRHFLTGEEDERGIKDALWWHPAGREMTQKDWNDAGLHAFATLLRGDRTHGPDARGRSRQDATFLLLFNSGEKPITFALPFEEAGTPREWVAEAPFAGEDAGTAYHPDDPVVVEGRKVLVLRAVPSPKKKR
ncbi:MAG: glycogen debranching enzyme GlgX, partial [Rhodothermales bacterium]|nr:glycogen debranching enzyme GlgX [Rhodothermales bacterium]